LKFFRESEGLVLVTKFGLAIVIIFAAVGMGKLVIAVFDLVIKSILGGL
jgi:hypothetical protein